ISVYRGDSLHILPPAFMRGVSAEQADGGSKIQRKTTPPVKNAAKRHFASPLFKAGAKGGCAAGANELPDKWQFGGKFAVFTFGRFHGKIKKIL
ncbi:MAG: hypothetical protein J6Q30_04140, partial [Oscillospiraceae bacterium]|nr:hypothetical protein [Oscillospiraceae bacterium]